MSEDVSGRSYFSYRYAVSGFIFVLLVFMLNLDLAINVFLSHQNQIRMDLAGIIGIITFLASPSLGFVIVQYWYMLFECAFRSLFWEKSKSKWIEKGITKPESWDTNIWVTQIDYWIYEKKRIKSSTVNYLTRRWDLFHTLASTALAIIVVVISGYLLRLLYFSFTSSDVILGLLRFLHFSLTPYCARLDFLRTEILHPLTIFHTVIIFASLASAGFTIIGAMGIREEHQEMYTKILESKNREVPARYLDNVV